VIEFVRAIIVIAWCGGRGFDRQGRYARWSGATGEQRTEDGKEELLHAVMSPTGEDGVKPTSMMMSCLRVRKVISDDADW
jgi:hypothetical protein